MNAEDLEAARVERRAVFVLNLVIFAMSFGFYILYPLLANHLKSWQKMAAITVSLIMNIRVLTQDALMLPVGALLRRLSCHWAVALGGMIRGLGFLLFTITDQVPWLLLASILTGIGGALFFPATHMLYTRLTHAGNRMDIFAKRERLNSIGAVAGPLVGTLIARFGFLWVGLVSAGVFFAASLYLLAAMPKSYAIAYDTSSAPRIRDALQNRPFLVFTVAVTLIMLLNNQTTLALAIRVDQIDPAYRFVGLFSSLSAILMVLFQVPSLRFFKTRMEPSKILMLSALLFMLGYAAIGGSPSINSLYLGAIACSLGTMLFAPTRDVMLSAYAGNRPAAAYYGFLGVGNTLSTFLLAPGIGALYELSSQAAYRLTPWLALIFAGLLSVFCLRKTKDPVSQSTQAHNP